MLAYRAIHNAWPRIEDLVWAISNAGDRSVFPDDGGPLRGRGTSFLQYGGLDAHNHTVIKAAVAWLRENLGDKAYRIQRYDQFMNDRLFKRKRIQEAMHEDMGTSPTPPPKRRAIRAVPAPAMPTGKPARQTIGDAEAQAYAAPVASGMAQLSLQGWQVKVKPTRPIRTDAPPNIL